MFLFDSVKLLNSEIFSLKSQGQKIALVPTMGYLHDGHLSLIEIAKKNGDKVIISIFVNPLQFNDIKDLEKYPNDLERDLNLLKGVEVHAAFAPNKEEIYSKNFQSKVFVTYLSKSHEGEFRPGHFDGVTTVVSILFNIVRPDVAVFGEKDFQQLRIIEQMVFDLKYPIEIIRAPIVREEDGLALSSRNFRLLPKERKIAAELSKSLFIAKKWFLSGERKNEALIGFVTKHLSKFPEIKVEYARIVDEETLKEHAEVATSSRILLAAYVGDVRLIDNIAL